MSFEPNIGEFVEVQTGPYKGKTGTVSRKMGRIVVVVGDDGADMMLEPGTDIIKVPRPEPPTEETANELEIAARLWIATNPNLYGDFVTFAREAKAAGHKRLGIGALTERVRWKVSVTTKDTEGFKVCNSHRAYIARKMVEDFPFEFGNGFFTFRKVRAKT